MRLVLFLCCLSLLIVGPAEAQKQTKAETKRAQVKKHQRTQNNPARETHLRTTQERLYAHKKIAAKRQQSRSHIQPLETSKSKVVATLKAYDKKRESIAAEIYKKIEELGRDEVACAGALMSILALGYVVQDDHQGFYKQHFPQQCKKQKELRNAVIPMLIKHHQKQCDSEWACLTQSDLSELTLCKENTFLVRAVLKNYDNLDALEKCGIFLGGSYHVMYAGQELFPPRYSIGQSLIAISKIIGK